MDRRHRYKDCTGTADGPVPRQLTEADVDAAWCLIERSVRYQAAGGLYEVAWQWRNLSRERLAYHLQSGDGWGVDVNGELAALALINRSREDEALCAGYVDGLDEALTIILRGLCRLAAQQGYASVHVKPVAESALISAVENAGYERNWDRDIWIFERALKGESDQCA